MTQRSDAQRNSGSAVPVPPIMRLRMPDELLTVKSGELPDSLLNDIRPFGRLYYKAALSYQVMKRAARAQGIMLVPISAGDTYRTLAAQTAAFLARYQREPIPGATTRTWQGVKWYLKRGNAPLASPGGSRHNLGLAVDFADMGSPATWRWMCENALRFGWSLEVMPAEPWHWFYYCGDKVPQGVLEAPTQPSAPS
jgi:hypothetical protein